MNPKAAELFHRAKFNRQRAYAKYSHYPVGAVLMTQDGSLFDGCCVENGSIGLTICAERAALCSAVFAGLNSTPELTAKLIVVAGPEGVSCSPCGACRQWIAELAPDSEVAFWWSGELVQHPIAELAPLAYGYPNV
jgi:cytidine deaminase